MRLVSLRAKSPSQGGRVDVANDAIRNLEIIRVGQMDSKFILSTLGQLSSGEIPACFNRSANPESLGTVVGKVTNAYLSDDGVRADVQFGPYAKNMPGMGGDGSSGDVQGYLMDLMGFDPEALALYIVLEPDPYKIIRCNLTSA